MRDMVFNEDMDLPLVTIITATLNAVDGLQRTMQSVRAQCYRNIEYVVVDGGSIDGSVDVIRCNGDIVAYWVSEKDSGLYDAINKGIDASKGDLVHVLNAGDVYSDDEVLSKMVQAYRDEGALDVVLYGRVRKRAGQKGEYLFGDKASWYTLQKGCEVPHPATVITRSVYEKWGGYSTRYLSMGDYDMLYRLYFKAGVRFVDTGVVVVDFDEPGISSSFRLCVREGFFVRMNNGGWYLVNLFFYLRSWLAYGRNKLFGKNDAQ